MKWLLISVCFIISNSIYCSQELAQQFYLNKDYTKAKEVYERILKHSPNSFSLNYNLASTYYRLNDHYHAKLYYLKAQQINPQNEDVRHNLSIVNQHFIDKKLTVKEMGTAFGWLIS